MKDEQAAVATPIDVAILTVAREPSYVAQTVASMLLGTNERPKITLACGSSLQSYLRAIRHHRALRVSSLAVDPARLASMSIEQRIAANFCHALRLEPLDRDLVVAEDDIVVADFWYEQAMAIRQAVRGDRGERFLVALFCGQRVHDEGRGYGYYPTPRKPESDGAFLSILASASVTYGGQLVLVSAPLREPLARYVEKRCIERTEVAHDVALGFFAAEQGIPMLAASPSLAQHVGEMSTHGDARHEIPVTFRFFSPGPTEDF